MRRGYLKFRTHLLRSDFAQLQKSVLFFGWNQGTKQIKCGQNKMVMDHKAEMTSFYLVMMQLF